MSSMIRDQFNGSDTNPLGDPFITVTSFNDMRVVGNKVRGSTTGGSGNQSRYITHSSSDQKTTVVLKTAGANGQIGASVRCAAAAMSCYVVHKAGIFDSGNQFVMFKFVAGVFTDGVIVSGVIGSVAGDTIGIEAVGTRVAIFKNDVEVGSVTDGSLTSGCMGLRCFDSADITLDEIDDFTGVAFSKTNGAGWQGHPNPYNRFSKPLISGSPRLQGRGK